MSVMQFPWDDESGQSVNVNTDTPGKIKISSPKNRATVARSLNLVVKTTKGTPEVSKVLSIRQAAAVYTYELLLTADKTSLPASGGVSTITGNLKVFIDGVLDRTDPVTLTCSGTSSGFSISGNKVTAESRGTVEGAIRNITVTCKTTTQETKEEVSKTIVISQAANSATYGEVTISGGTVADIPASGGSVSSATGITTSQTVTYTSGATRPGKVTVSYDTVSAPSLTYNIKPRTQVGVLTATATGEGSKVKIQSINIYQKANDYHYSDKTALKYIQQSRGGELVVEEYPTDTEYYLEATSDGFSLYFKVYALFDSGYEGILYNDIPEPISDVIIDGWGPYFASDQCEFDGFDRPPYNGSVYYSYDLILPENKSSNPIPIELLFGGLTSDDIVISNIIQRAGVKTYANPVITGFSYAQVPASGGSVTPTVTYSQTWGWNGATTGGGTITSGASLSYAKQSGSATVEATTGKVTAASRGTTVDSAATTAATVRLTVTMNGKSSTKDASVTQQQNQKTTISYGSWTVSISGDKYTSSSSPCPASGGSINITSSASRTRTQNYTSGATSTLSPETGTPTISSSGISVSNNVATFASRGTTVGSQITATVTASYSGVTKSISVYQEANAITDYGVPTISGGSASDIPASGGSVKASGCTASQVITYTSKATRSGSVSLSYSTVSANSLGTTVKERTLIGNSVATATGEGSKTATKNIPVYQSANAATTITYGEITISSFTVNDIPAAGGTLSSGTIAYSQPRTQNYTSGATSALSALTSGANVSYTSVTATSKGTTVSGRTDTGKDMTVTVSMNGKTATKSVSVYQAANSQTLTSISIKGTASAGAVDAIPEVGGTVTWACTASYSYTSGSTSSGSIAASSVTWSVSGTGASQSSNITTWAKNTTTSARTATVTASYGGKSTTGTTKQVASDGLIKATYNDKAGYLNNICAAFPRS